jgi:hypothetical protein
VHWNRADRVRSGLILAPSVLRNVGVLSIAGVGTLLYSDNLKRWFSLNKARCESSTDFTRAARDKPVTVESNLDGQRQTKGAWNSDRYTSVGAQQEKPGHQEPPPQTKAGEDGDEVSKVRPPPVLPCTYAGPFRWVSGYQVTLLTIKC